MCTMCTGSTFGPLEHRAPGTFSAVIFGRLLRLLASWCGSRSPLFVVRLFAQLPAERTRVLDCVRTCVCRCRPSHMPHVQRGRNHNAFLFFFFLQRPTGRRVLAGGWLARLAGTRVDSRRVDKWVVGLREAQRRSGGEADDGRSLGTGGHGAEGGASVDRS